MKLASALRLNESGLRGALDHKEFEAAVLADEREATELGVSGVPAFIADRRFALSGVQPLVWLQDLVGKASELRR